MTTFIRPSLPRLLAAALLACACLAAPPAAQAQAEAGLSSGYLPFESMPFFILADRQFGSGDEALLRVEVPARDGGRQMLEAYGGVDVLLYRVPQPLAFLKAQKNLHRVDVRARPRDEGLANTLSYLWDNAWKKSRLAWRDLFDAKTRGTVTAAAPALQSRPALLEATEFRAPQRFKPLEGYELVDRFRYPVWQAQAIKPPEVKLQGSSSDFIPASEGNIHVPLGKLKPGLYLVEAIIGSHRAATLLFVSDTVAVTKIAAGALTVWTANRNDGRPVAGSRLLWTDGVGTLKSATTAADGLATLAHASPERTYLLGEDAAGGVFVSENFYYDSEIHDTKLYAVTDRPLYRPGDLVRIKFLGRDFQSASRSRPARAGELRIEVNDPNGTPVLATRAPLAPDSGADTAFRLPDNAVAGGYEIRIGYEDKRYGAAFRVAEYVKPHFEIELLPDQQHYKTGEPVSGKVRLAYPDGKPVKDAAVELTLRAQTLTMVQGELRYSGLFPVQLSTASLTTDGSGEARFALPAAREPSRLVLTLLATDGAAYRVRSSRELLVERAASSWKLVAARNFTLAGDKPGFRLEAEGDNAALPARWEIVRLEDQSRTSGDFDPAARSWTPALARPGSYSLMLRDAAGNIVAATAHWVGGGKDKDGLQVAPGSIEMVADKPGYQPGETAEVLISFPEPVDEALLTLERDGVDATALLSRGAGWLRTERLAPNQWRARIPVTEAHAPNITFSAVYVKHGDYVFQNAGLVVEAPRLALDIRSDADTVQPGDTVTVDIQATLRGKPAPALLTVSVVDEMVYALQPEIAPGLPEFLQHIRRNNVRTGASLNFIAYDEAMDWSAAAARQPPARHQYNERGVKVLERPRRDDTDTAAWLPALKTDAEGRARFSFRMPDALSRWRITVRALGLDGADGVPGQRTAYVRSDKPLYAKWTSPDWLREGDAPQAALAVFNNAAEERKAEVVLTLAGKEVRQAAELRRGVNYLVFALPPFKGRETARVEVKEGGRTVDALETPFTVRGARWRGPRERMLSLHGDAPAPVELPADARDLRLRLVAGGGEHFLRIADDLIDYPWGCTEQTASRLIPLALVTPLLAPRRNAEGEGGRLWQTLYSQRLRLAALAGPQAVFGWWGDGSEQSALMTAYAYYADWYAARTLGIELPAAHWERVLAAYRNHASREPLLHRALALWFAQEIGLPVRTQAEGLLRGLAEAKAPEDAALGDETWSPFLAAPDGALGVAHARVLAALIAQRAQAPLPAGFDAALAEAQDQLAASRRPAARALLLLAGKEAKTAAPDILAAVGNAMPTLDRALTLVWTRKALGEIAPGAPAGRPLGAWQAATTAFGQPEWRWPASSPLPGSLQIEGIRLEGRGADAPPLTAVLRYEADEAAGPGTLPVGVERHLYRLARGDKGYTRTPVKPEDGLSVQALYLDEIVLKADAVHRHGLVEAALPPGVAVERGTWGIALLDGGPQAAPLERARAEEHSGSYGVPVDRLEGTVTVRHLLRVAQPGRFVLPPARYYRMYQPEQKALADKGEAAVWVVK
ncbi:MG2 domain-containing protein [Thauera sinica]|uniref:MG2 domain-containing protein n=1 Tax=Thauera sinica TaxID=2665146 RepID=A0ABW1AXA0_9RHOO|nr:alpha-2-macroglobulin [Thauera sp. K11]